MAVGSLVNVAAVQPIYKAGGRWNTYEIYAKGPEITVKMNGTVTVSAAEAKFLGDEDFVVGLEHALIEEITDREEFGMIRDNELLFRFLDPDSVKVRRP